MTPERRRRLTYVALALATIGLGLGVHLGGAVLGPVATERLVVAAAIGCQRLGSLDTGGKGAYHQPCHPS